jgi:protein translocase SecG subunit
MNIALFIIQILLGVVVTGLILLQSSKGGLGGGLGAGELYRSKRGAEKIVFTATIVFASLFLVTSILSVFLR